jgi:hypothetical protein
MGFADEGPSDYPIVQCDLADVLGAPGMPARAELARSLSTARHRWSAMAGGDKADSSERRNVGDFWAAD